MTEITRRSPTDLRVLESHPGVGLDDCLGIMDTSGRNLLNLNRSGTLSIYEALDGKRVSKTQAHFFDGLVADVNITNAVNQICRQIDVPSYKILPPTTRETLVYRFITAMLEQSVLSRRVWECRNGYFDTTGLGEGVRRDFDDFPLAKKHMKGSDAGAKAPFPSAYNYWFIQVNGTSQLCLSMDGLVWDRDFNVTDLFPEYKKRHRVWPLIFATAGFLLN